MNAHDHHPAAAHNDAHAPAGADAGAGKRPLVPDDPVASASKTHSVDAYKKRVGQFMADVFSVKHDAIISFGNPLSRSNGNPPHSLLGDALKFVIAAAGGPFVDALEVGVAAGAIIRTAIPELASAVGSSVGQSGSSGADSLATASFVTDYAHAVKEHHAIVTRRLENAIHSEQGGKDIVQALGGEPIAGRLQLTSAQEGRVRSETQRETLDAWTLAMQKTGDKKDHNQQGYSDPSTGQLHLDGLLLHANGQLASGGQARMEGVGNDAAQLNANRKLKDIKVQRTMNVRWDYPGFSGGFGMSISASGHMADDEFGHDDKTAAAMFYDGKSLFPVTSDDVKKDDAIVDRDYRKGLHKIWNIIHDKTPRELGFSIKGD